MRAFSVLLAASLFGSLASAGHLVPGAYVGTGTSTYTEHDERDGSTLTCPDKPIVAVFTVESPSEGTLRFHQAADGCRPLGWSDGVRMRGDPGTGYTYTVLECFEETQVTLGPLGPATAFTYQTAWLTYYGSGSEDAAQAALCTPPDDAEYACMCPLYRIDAVIAFS